MIRSATDNELSRPIESDLFFCPCLFPARGTADRRLIFMPYVAAGVASRTPQTSQSSGAAKRFNGDGHLDTESASTRVFNSTDTSEDRATEDCEKADLFRQLLADAGVRELRGLRVEVGDGLLRLYGRVPTFYAKQMAQEKLRPYSIGLKIDNRVIVDLP